MAMRASGLLVGGGLLVASWVAWFAASGPMTGPRTLHAAPARAPAVRVPIGRSTAAEAAPARGVPALAIFAELRDGTPLSTFLTEQGAAGTLSIAVFERPPALLQLAADGGVLGVLTTRTTRLPRAGGEDEPAFVAMRAFPPTGAWVALYFDGVLLDARLVAPSRTLLRFELDAAALYEALGLPLT